MIQLIHEFITKPEQQSRFELAFGPGGSWSRLFSKSPGFRGITLLADKQDSRRYLSIEVWDSVSFREQAMEADRAAYDEVQSSLEEWIETQAALGVFRLLSQATIRPIGRG